MKDITRKNQLDVINYFLTGGSLARFVLYTIKEDLSPANICNALNALLNAEGLDSDNLYHKTLVEYDKEGNPTHHIGDLRLLKGQVCISFTSPSIALKLTKQDTAEVISQLENLALRGVVSSPEDLTVEGHLESVARLVTKKTKAKPPILKSPHKYLRRA
jgi:hypothetical protein